MAGERMPRIAPILILGLAGWIASDTGSASAQSVQLPKCDLDVVRGALANRQVQAIVGCRVEDVRAILQRYDFAIREHPDSSVSGIEARTILSVKPGPSVVDVTVSTGAGYPPPEVHRPRFSIQAPAKVQEGQPLTFTVHRENSDERAHQITLSPKPPELLKGALAPFDFSPGKTDEIITVETAPGQPGDGDRTLEISLTTDESADVGDPQPATVQIIDTPAATYEIVPPQNVARGDPLVFEVRRTGPLLASRLEYELLQGGTKIEPDGLPHPLTFGAGEDRKSLELRPDFYSRCDLPPTLILHDESGHSIEATAFFSDSCPPPHHRTWLEKLNEDAPWWPIPAGILVLGVITYGVRKLWPRPLPPTLYPTWDVEADPVPPALDPPRILDWPKFSTSVTVEWGGAIVPQPLPIAETKDG